MGDGLNAAAGQIQIGNRRGPQDSKRVEPLGRDIDVTVGIERRRPYKEQGCASMNFLTDSSIVE